MKYDINVQQLDILNTMFYPYVTKHGRKKVDLVKIMKGFFR